MMVASMAVTSMTFNDSTIFWKCLNGIRTLWIYVRNWFWNQLIKMFTWQCCCCFGDVLNFNKSRSYDADDDDGSSNINARADSIDCGRRLCTNDDTLLVRWVIVDDDDVGDEVTIDVDTLGFCNSFIRFNKWYDIKLPWEYHWKSILIDVVRCH